MHQLIAGKAGDEAICDGAHPNDTRQEISLRRSFKGWASKE